VRELEVNARQPGPETLTALPPWRNLTFNISQNQCAQVTFSHRTRFLGEWACSATDLAAIFIESLTVAAVAFSDEER